MWNNHKALNLLANLILTGAVLSVAYFLVVSMIKLPLFDLKEIIIESVNNADQSDKLALQHTNRQQIERVVGDAVIGNFFTVDLNRVKDAFQELPWVRVAKVQRNWPLGIKVILEEHTALAYWGDTALVNFHGEIFRAPSDKVLPVFRGPTGESAALIAEQYKIMNRTLSPINQHVAEISLSPRYAWFIRLDNGTLLKLGRKKIKSRLERYISVYKNNIVNLNQSIPLDYVDLRYPSGFAVRMDEVMPATISPKPISRRKS
jgi:cell division protein FtsQ